MTSSVVELATETQAKRAMEQLDGYLWDEMRLSAHEVGSVPVMCARVGVWAWLFSWLCLSFVMRIPRSGDSRCSTAFYRIIEHTLETAYHIPELSLSFPVLNSCLHL